MSLMYTINFLGSLIAEEFRFGKSIFTFIMNAPGDDDLHCDGMNHLRIQPAHGNNGCFFRIDRETYFRCAEVCSRVPAVSSFYFALHAAPLGKLNSRRRDWMITGVNTSHVLLTRYPDIRTTSARQQYFFSSIMADSHWIAWVVALHNATSQLLTSLHYREQAASDPHPNGPMMDGQDNGEGTGGRNREGTTSNYCPPFDGLPNDRGSPKPDDAAVCEGETATEDQPQTRRQYSRDSPVGDPRTPLNYSDHGSTASSGRFMPTPRREGTQETPFSFGERTHATSDRYYGDDHYTQYDDPDRGYWQHRGRGGRPHRWSPYRGGFRRRSNRRYPYWRNPY